MGAYNTVFGIPMNSQTGNKDKTARGKGQWGPAENISRSPTPRVVFFFLFPVRLFIAGNAEVL